MPYFFIEMGQAIVGDRDLTVTTSGLTGCTLIAGWDRLLKKIGAYHYPADGLKDDKHKKVLDHWLKDLRPTKLILVYGHEWSDFDKKHLMQYLHEHQTTSQISVNNDSGGVLVIGNPKFGVLRGDAMVAKIGENTYIDVHKKYPTQYDEKGFKYKLFGNGVAPGKFKYDVMNEEFPD